METMRQSASTSRPAGATCCNKRAPRISPSIMAAVRDTRPPEASKSRALSPSRTSCVCRFNRGEGGEGRPRGYRAQRGQIHHNLYCYED